MTLIILSICETVNSEKCSFIWDRVSFQIVFLIQHFDRCMVSKFFENQIDFSSCFLMLKHEYF